VQVGTVVAFCNQIQVLRLGHSEIKMLPHTLGRGATHRTTTYHKCDVKQFIAMRG
jgi:hypothetical protein